MSDEDIRLDGNAVAGALAEVFAADVTAAIGVCGHCGYTSEFGRVHVYESGPGTVLRCPTCEGMVMRFARVPGRLMVDVSGFRLLELPA